MVGSPAAAGRWLAAGGRQQLVAGSRLSSLWLVAGWWPGGMFNIVLLKLKNNQTYIGLVLCRLAVWVSD